jgi:hypothetical protein
MPTSNGTVVITEAHRGDTVILNIMLDNPVGVAGCAFSLEYDPAIFIPPATNAEGLPVNSGDILSVFPFTFQTGTIPLTQTHRENSSESGKIYFAGAAIDTTDGGPLYDAGSALALFTVKLHVKKDAALGNATLTLKQTELWNLAAGYGTDVGQDGSYDAGVDQMGKAAVLVGALDQGDPDYDDPTKAFPVLIGDQTEPLDTLSLGIQECTDTDGDGLCDYAETNTGVFVDADDTGTNPADSDSDNDGLLDGDEINTQNTDPNKSDTDGDGFNDKEEIDRNTDPNDETDYPLYLSIAGPGSLNLDTEGKYLVTADIPPGETLKEYQIKINFDPAILRYEPRDITGMPFPPNDVNTSTPGEIIITGSDINGVPGPVKISLVDFTFTGILAGSTDLALTIVKFGENDGNQFPMIPVDQPVEVVVCAQGDADMSGEVDIFDALMIAQYSAMIIGQEQVPGFLCCDVDCSGEVDIFDALKVAQYAAMIIPNLDCE